MMTYRIYLPDDKGQAYTQFSYPAGELQVRFTEEQVKAFQGADVLQIVARIKNSEDFMALVLLVNAVSLLDYNGRVDLVLPYLPYSRADRSFGVGDCFGLQAFGDIVNSLCVDQVYTVDVHSDKAPECLSCLVNVSPLTLIARTIDVIGAVWDLAIVLPDKGADRYELSSLMQNIYHCDKIRDEKTGKLLGFTVPQEIKRHKKALIVDDICDGGGTFIGIAKELQGVELYLYVTHGIFSKGTEELLKYFTKIFSTDSFSTADVEGVTKFPCMPLLLEGQV
jgi:ribose-phosphate pyrophosphokinase